VSRQLSDAGFTPPPFEARQYLFTLVLLGLGLWCARDGWFNTDEGMQKYLLFNRAGAVLFLAWGAIDGWRMRRREVEHARRQWQAARAAPEPESLP
jgi:hypothetical protein